MKVPLTSKKQRSNPRDEDHGYFRDYERAACANIDRDATTYPPNAYSFIHCSEPTYTRVRSGSKFNTLVPSLLTNGEGFRSTAAMARNRASPQKKIHWRAQRCIRSLKGPRHWKLGELEISSLTMLDDVVASRKLGKSSRHPHRHPLRLRQLQPPAACPPSPALSRTRLRSGRPLALCVPILLARLLHSIVGVR